MGKYKKSLREERAKVKLKGKDKKLLPKGQNVTDVNFKVKKIVIKTQLKDHGQNEPLSTRKLSLEDILKRLGHYNSNESLEAVGQLENLLKSNQAVLSLNLSSVVIGLAKLIVSPHFVLRKAATKLLSTVLSQVSESEWPVLKDRVTGYLICGLSHVEPAVRSNCLVSLKAIPSSLSLPGETLLPCLLDLMSTGLHSGSRSLSTHVTSSPTSFRTSVLLCISTVLKHLPKNQSPTTWRPRVTECKEIKVSNTQSLRIFLKPLYSSLEGGLSISEFNPLASSTSASFNIKEFSSSLIPLMLDSFTEIAPEVDIHEPVCTLNAEGIQLLSIVAKVLLQLHDLLSSSDSNGVVWMRSKFGETIWRRLVDERFPYSEEVAQSKKKPQSKPKTSSVPLASTQQTNLTLAFLAISLAPASSPSLVSRFLCEVIRSDNVPEEEEVLFERCLSVCLHLPLAKPMSMLKESLLTVKRGRRVYKVVFSTLSSLLVEDQTKFDDEAMSSWLEYLLDSSKSEALPQEVVDLLTKAAPTVTLPQLFHSSYSNLLGKGVQVGGDYLWSVVSLLYWVDQWDTDLLNSLQEIAENQSLPRQLTSHLVNLVKHRCEAYPDGKLRFAVNQHPFWKKNCLYNM